MSIPFFDGLDEAKHVLIAGAGGGFDVFAGLPLYFRLNITPVMAIYWAFDLDAVAGRLLYAKMIADTESYGEVSLAIEAYRASLPMVRPHRRTLD